MRNDWQQFLEQLGQELYHNPTAYQTLLPELAGLNRHGNKWQSAYKLNGERGKHGRADKTIILETYPLVLIEHGDTAKNLVKYLMSRDSTDFITTLKQMAGLVGMDLPKGDFDSEQWLQKQHRKEMFATVQDYYQWNLHNAPKAITDYLHSRFTDAELEAMGLGYIPSKEQLANYLSGKGYDKELVSEFVNTMCSAIGYTHQITVPIYRAGNVYSFIYRHHNQQGTDKQKYKYHTGVKLGDMLQYIPASLRKESDLVVVEGQLDALHLKANGIKNVVSCGTNGINQQQATDAIKRGCRVFTLLYDADPTDTDPDKNQKARSRAAKNIVEAAKAMGLANDVKVFVAELPQPDNTQKADPSDYLKAHGKEALQKVIDTAPRHWQYELNHIVGKYGKLQSEQGELTPKQLDSFTASVLYVSDSVTAPMERRDFKNHLAEIYNGADDATIEQMLEEHQAKRKKEAAQREAAQLMQQATNLLNKGQAAEAMELQNRATAILAGVEAGQEFEKLTSITTKADIVAELQTLPEAISTGLYLGEQCPENEILLPAGALSVLAAPTSHGKTTMLVALAVHTTKTDPSKEYYLFSYEEAETSIIIKALSSYADIELSNSNRKTIQHHLTTDSWQYAHTKNKDELQEYQRKEDEFFTMLEQGRLKIHYTNMVCETLCSTIRKLAKNGKLGGVFIDYVQYLELADSRRYERHEEISKICRMLKDVAVDTNTPIILAAQFNRQVTDPTKLALQNIGEGGDIERKAAFCLGFWNNDMPILNTDKINERDLQQLTGGAVFDAEHPSKNKSITAIVLKNRSGIGAKAGTTGLLSFNGNIGTVKNHIKKFGKWD